MVFQSLACAGRIASSAIVKAFLFLKLSLKLELLTVPEWAHARSMPIHEKRDPSKC